LGRCLYEYDPRDEDKRLGKWLGCAAQ
jgi:hypothetical protein